MEKVRSDRVDVAIVGGGVVAHVLACALARSIGADFTIAVIAPARSRGPAGPGSTRGAGFGAKRAIALGRGSVAMLSALGIWPALEGAAQAMDRIVVSDGRAGGSQLSLLEFSDDGSGAGASAHVVDEAVLGGACADGARGETAVRWIEDTVSDIACGADSARLVLTAGPTLEARLAVAADGARSLTRQQAGIKTVGWRYRQAAIVAEVAHSRDHHGVALERFLPAGPFAVLPLPGRTSSLVWTENEKRAKALIAGDADEFRRALMERWDSERGHPDRIGPAATFPLSFHIARRFAAPRLALVGDAAHQVHPLAGQGLNLGLRDVAALTELVVDACRLGLTPGEPAQLDAYERWRRFDTVSSALGYDALNRLFSNDSDGLRVVRDLGLGLVDRLPGLKRAFMREAAGQSGAVPRLMAGGAL